MPDPDKEPLFDLYYELPGLRGRWVRYNLGGAYAAHMVRLAVRERVPGEVFVVRLTEYPA